MANVENAAASNAGYSDGFESISGVYEGFLGTGYSTAVELSFIAMGLIVCYVLYGTAKYVAAEYDVDLGRSIAETLGLR